ncbi:MAG TPA: VacJ family lipoprotein [Alphaproteobacteria bacterium]|nr:VacJ family lipoprotein [Alphaproteobacteria bacterium]
MKLSLVLRGRAILVGALAAGLVVSGCASTTSLDDPDAVYDPIEPVNRYIFEVNYFLDEMFIKPSAYIYRAALPDPAQRGVRNALSNLRMPWTAVNDLLQGEFDRAATAGGRFAINSTLGVLGLFDVADDFGLPNHEEDAGQTFAVWGLPEGPYIVLPIFGPSNVRDAVGLVGDYFGDPVNIVARQYPDGDLFLIGRGLLTGVSTREQVIEVLDELQRNSVDYYATLRSVYRQRRQNEIRNGAPEDDRPRPSASPPESRPVAVAPETVDESEPTAPFPGGGY